MNRTLIMVVSGIVLVLILAGATFVGAQMLNQGDGLAQGGGAGAPGQRVMEMIADDGNGNATPLRIIVEPAPNLPDEETAANGVFLRRADGSIFVGTGNIMLDVEMDGDTGESAVSLSSDGPEVEVVVTHETEIFEDTTDMDVDPSQAENGEVHLVQEIKAGGSLEDIDKNSEIQVWGEKRGERVVAKILVYRVVKAGF